MNPKSVVKKHFDDLCDEYDSRIIARRSKYLDTIDGMILQQLAEKKGLCLLDVGCGTGLRIQRMLKQLDIASLAACDISPRMVLAAKANGVAEAIEADIDSLPYPGQHFDAVFCLFNVLGYLPSDTHVLRALREIHRVLKPGGLLFVDVMNIWHLGEGLVFRKRLVKILLEMVKGLFSKATPWGHFFNLRVEGNIIPGYVRGFSKKSFRSLLRNAGFDAREVLIIGYDSGTIHSNWWKGQLFSIAVRTL